MTMLDAPQRARRTAVQSLHADCTADVYIDRTATMLETTPLITAQNTGKFRVNAWYTDKCTFLQNETNAFALRHTHHHVSHTEHLIVLRRMLSGNLWGRVGDMSTDYSPGPIYVMDQELQYEGIQETAVFQNVFILKSALGYDPETQPRATKIVPDSTAGRCLVNVWEAVFAQLGDQDSFVDTQLLEQFMACVVMALGAPADREDIRIHARNALFDIICRFIEDNLSDFELSVARLLNEFGVSRATLFRMFERVGGVRNYIRQRRATRALLDISRQPYKRGNICAAAAQWGFSSAPNFNRTIRSLYGFSPGAMFDLTPPSAISPFHSHFTTFIEKSRIRRGASS